VEKNSEPIWHRAILPLTASIAEAIDVLNGVSLKIVMVSNQDGVLEGTICDGDIRRGLLKGCHLKTPLSKIIHRNPLVVRPELARNLVVDLMLANKVQQIPVVDDKGCIVGLHLWDQVLAPPVRSNLMVIMAGGIGSRLHPFTKNCPKPLLMVSGRPMLEHIIERAKLQGFTNFILAINYLGNMIEEYFGDGGPLGVRINYLRENSPLGTAGALSLLDPDPEIPFLVTNGDVITDVNYGDLLDFHVRHHAFATMAVRVHEWQNPFGVVRTKGLEIIDFEEKPISRSYINAGVYALDPSCLSLLQKDAYIDMPSVFENVKTQIGKIIAYPMHEPWMDVGRIDDLLAANQPNNIRQ
jgi:dTDP-glucose pyrophosphorylase